jgi:hypothetical protein
MRGQGGDVRQLRGRPVRGVCSAFCAAAFSTGMGCEQYQAFGRVLLGSSKDAFERAEGRFSATETVVRRDTVRCVGIDTFAKVCVAWLFAERLLYVDWIEERTLS